MFTVSLAIVGMGMGPTSLSFILAVQHAVTWGQRGVATGAVIFFRTIGGAIGVGILGGALGWELGHYLLAPAPRASTSARRSGPRPIRCSTRDQLAVVQAGLGIALRDVYHPDAAPGAGHAGLHGLAAGQVVRELRPRAKRPSRSRAR